jgi:N-acetyl-gamma-glutamyl-phosphate reductase
MSRGIFTCVYAEPVDDARGAADYQAALEAAYEHEPFVTVLPPGRVPDTAHVRGSNRAHVAVAYDARTRRVLCMAAIDNLVKGASGQAIQAMNLALGWEETAGLAGVGVFP